MDERAQVLVATVLGATVGGLLGCLYLTERGRQVRAHMEPFLDSIIEELSEVRHTVDKARLAVEEGKRTLDDVTHRSPSPAA